MDIFDFMFIIQFVVLISIIMIKFYNVMSSGLWYDIKIAFVTWALFLIFWGVGGIILMINPTELIFLQLYRLGSWMILLNFVFLAIEIFFHIRDRTLVTMAAYSSKKMKGELADNGLKPKKMSLF